jgi:hypothetical protein
MRQETELRQVHHADYSAWMKGRDGAFDGVGSGFGGGYFVMDSDGTPSDERDRDRKGGMRGFHPAEGRKGLQSVFSFFSLAAYPARSLFSTSFRRNPNSALYLFGRICCLRICLTSAELQHFIYSSLDETTCCVYSFYSGTMVPLPVIIF